MLLIVAYLEVRPVLLELEARLVLFLHVLQLALFERSDVARAHALQKRCEHLVGPLVGRSVVRSVDRSISR